MKRPLSQSAFSPLSDAEIDEAEDNLVRCLEALDEKGEAGLEAELERIHPSPALTQAGLRRVPFMTSSHALRIDKSYLKTVNPDSSTPAKTKAARR
jgi:hypothetical protein